MKMRGTFWSCRKTKLSHFLFRWDFIGQLEGFEIQWNVRNITTEVKVDKSLTKKHHVFYFEPVC